IQTMSLSQRWMSQSKSICADWSFGSGRGFCASLVAGGGLNRSKRFTIAIVLPGREQFLWCVGSSRRRYVVFQNVAGIRLQPFGSCVRGKIDPDVKFLLGCGMSGVLVGERVESFNGVHDMPCVGLGVIHDRGQDPRSADDVGLCELAFCCP